MKVFVPPIKSQGIKTKLVFWINTIVPGEFEGLWIEPFMGTGVVGFNLAPKHALFCDSNPHLINFYISLSKGEITSEIVRTFLQKEGANLLEAGEEHYYKIRDRFNKNYSPLDFLFLNRSGFNGMIRFNRRGKLNTPFCRKTRRFAQAYVTKIVNQVSYVSGLLKARDFTFKCQDFEETIKIGDNNDIIYCDPPYIDRHADYYNGWNESYEKKLHEILSETPSRFILSTWHHNDFRQNKYINSLWSGFHIKTRKHFYHLGGSEKNRSSVVEAVVTNYETSTYKYGEPEQSNQLTLLEKREMYLWNKLTHTKTSQRV